MIRGSSKLEHHLTISVQELAGYRFIHHAVIITLWYATTCIAIRTITCSFRQIRATLDNQSIRGAA